MTDFPQIAAPDAQVATQARARQDTLTKPAGSLGRLEELSVWVAACQGVCPPKQFQRARVVVFAGDHGVTVAGVSAFPSEVTAQMVANFDSGGAAINVLADSAGATVRVVDIAVDVDEPLSASIGAHKVRRGSGNIAVEDALTADEAQAALDAGRRIADEEVDAGADLLVPGALGVGATTPASVLVAAITGTEPVAVVGRGSGIDDETWMRKAAAVRDALRRARPHVRDPLALLRVAGGAVLAVLTGFLVQAALRRTPVLLDGLVAAAAALVADELAPGAREWWLLAQGSPEPAFVRAADHLELTPLLELQMRTDDGSGALTALPLVAMAARLLAETTTVADSGIAPATRAGV